MLFVSAVFGVTVTLVLVMVMVGPLIAIALTAIVYSNSAKP